MKRLLKCIPAVLLVLFAFALLTASVPARSAFSGRTGGSLNFVAAQQCGLPGGQACPCKEEEAEGHGDGVTNDGKTTRMDTDVRKDCDDHVSGDESFEEGNHRCTGGRPRELTTVMNAATETGDCTTEDGSNAKYTILLVRQAPLKANLYAINWTTSTGSSYHASGAFINGYVLVQ